MRCEAITESVYEGTEDEEYHDREVDRDDIM